AAARHFVAIEDWLADGIPMATPTARTVLVDWQALKFQKLARIDPDSAAARHFVAIEDWLADGIPMATPTARTVLVDWQVRNLTAARAWRFLGARSIRARSAPPPSPFAACGIRSRPPRWRWRWPRRFPARGSRRRAPAMWE
ncbi:hypothetical protein CNY89_04295, partial [Amaricoccus sp. HAR-UPW-R2A-40]